MIKPLKAALITLAAYLAQVCLMPYCKIGGIMPSSVAVCLAVITVSLGKRYAFCAAAASGILLEAMTASVGGLYAIVYPAAGLLFAQVFADMSDEKREQRKNRGKFARDLYPRDVNPHIRTPLCAMCIAASVEVVLLVYVTLSGAPLTFGHIVRLLGAVLYTGALAVALMVPLRAILRMYGGRVRRAMYDEEVAT